MIKHDLSDELRGLIAAWDSDDTDDWHIIDKSTLFEALRRAADALDELQTRIRACETGGSAIILMQECTISNLKTERDELRRQLDESITSQERLAQLECEAQGKKHSFRQRAEKAEARVKRLEEALKWYAQPINWAQVWIDVPVRHGPLIRPSAIQQDEGKIARQALEEPDA